MELLNNQFEKRSSQTLLEASIQYAKTYCKNYNKNQRKPIGQFFTPLQVAKYMASQIRMPKDDFSLLDPGAGTGILIAAICDRIYSEYENPITVTIHAYENDFNIIPELDKTLNHCKSKLSKKGHTLKYSIIKRDFIRVNSKYIPIKSKNTLFRYDIVISNPPYYKLKKKSIQSKIMTDFVSGQPNIYSFFVILSLKMLKKDGQFVFITPRSFCSGLYYKKMRKWLLDNSCITKIHIFNSRSKVFEMDKILQEVLIIAGEIQTTQKCESVEISLSSDCTFSDEINLNIPYSLINPKKNDESYIRIPINETEINIINIVDSWNNTLEDFGFNISTGKVVDFRTKNNLRINYDEKGCVPLIWMQNLEIGKINLSLKNFQKPQAIKENDKTSSLLVPVKNYVVLKRFTTKNDKKRLFAVPFQKKDFKQFKYIGFENHLNYVYKKEGELSQNEMFGISALFNSKLMDCYYRSISGNTQVNATDIRKLPLPDYDVITSLGEYSRKHTKDDYNDYLMKILS